jgi:hypothetical protein
LGWPVQDWFSVSRLETLPVSGHLSTQIVQIRDLLNLCGEAVEKLIREIVRSRIRVREGDGGNDDRRIVVSHYTKTAWAEEILIQQMIVPMQGVEAHVYVMQGRSTPRRAKRAGARSVEARIVFKAQSTELELDPEQTMRRETDISNFIPEAKRFWRPGPVSLGGREATMEIPGFLERLR